MSRRIETMLLILTTTLAALLAMALARHADRRRAADLGRMSERWLHECRASSSSTAY